MTDRNLLRGMAVLLLLTVVLAFLEAREQRQWRSDSAARLLAMEERLDKLDGEMTDMQVSMAELQKHSVKNVVGRANDALVEGFSGMMGALRQELEQLGDIIDESMQQDDQPPADQPADEPSN